MNPYHRLPGKQRVPVRGHHLAYLTAGEGNPVIVLLSGAGMDMDSWSRVFPAATAISTVLVHDRPGTGASDPPTRPQTGDEVVADLRGLLDAVGLAAPYVLVGHSLGGLHANLFARLVPGVVAGMVLVDASHPDEVERRRAERAPIVIRAINRVFAAVDSARGRSRLSENAFVDDTVRQIRAAGPFPDIPLIVVSGGRKMPLVPETAFRAHLDGQRDLVALSPQGRQIVAEKSGHFPQIDEPGVVVDAIREIVTVGRRMGPSHAPARNAIEN